MKKDHRHIDPFDHGYLHLQNELVGVQFHAKFITKAFHKRKMQAVKHVCFYEIAQIHYSHKGFFHIDDFIETLKEYGYNYSNRGSKFRLKKQLNDFFKETENGHYGFTSRRTILGYKRSDKTLYDQTREKSILHKKNKKTLTDILICINASGQTIPTENLCNQTGFKRSRIFQALKNGAELGFEKLIIKAYVHEFDNEFDAQQFRKAHYQENMLLDIEKQDNKYYVFAKVGNYFKKLNGVSSDGEVKTIKSLRDTPNLVEKVIKRTNFKTNIHHVTQGTKDLFLFAEFTDISEFFSKYRKEKNEPIIENVLSHYKRCA